MQGATLTRSVLPAHLVAESERDYTPFLGVLPTLYGTCETGGIRTLGSEHWDPNAEIRALGSESWDPKESR